MNSANIGHFALLIPQIWKVKIRSWKLEFFSLFFENIKLHGRLCARRGRLMLALPNCLFYLKYYRNNLLERWLRNGVLFLTQIWKVDTTIRNPSPLKLLIPQIWKVDTTKSSGFPNTLWLLILQIWKVDTTLHDVWFRFNTLFLTQIWKADTT